MTEMVRVAGRRWTIEEGFEQTKGEVGLDQYEVRRYDAWYRYITLALLAHAYLEVTRLSARAGHRGTGKGGSFQPAEQIPLTLPEVRRSGAARGRSRRAPSARTISVVPVAAPAPSGRSPGPSGPPSTASTSGAAGVRDPRSDPHPGGTGHGRAERAAWQRIAPLCCSPQRSHGGDVPVATCGANWRACWR